MYTLPNQDAISTVVANTDVASGGDAVVTINGTSGAYVVIDFISAGFYDTPSANTALVVTDTTNSTTLFQAPLTSAGPAFWLFGSSGLSAPAGASVQVKLEDGGQIKDLVVKYR